MTTAPNQDAAATQWAQSELMVLPSQVHDAEVLLADLNFQVREHKRLLDEAETDAQINAVVDGKNAETRKLQLEQAVSNNAGVLQMRGTLTGLEAQYISAEVDFNGLHRRWKSALALAELQAAKIGYLATYKQE